MIRTICSVLLVAAAVPASAETLMLVPTYDEVGTNADGSTYTGTVTVESLSDSTFAIRWKIGSTSYSGFGMRHDDTLAATYMVGGQPGLIIYKVGDDGTLSGLWSIRGQNGSGTDRLIPHR